MSSAGMEEALRICLCLSMHNQVSEKRNLMTT
jgi:hypothetical protein